MVDLSNGSTIKRGGFVRDTRTDMIVKVTEIGGRDVMVKPAYKSDGIWVDPSSLRPVADPHPWSWSHTLRTLVVVGLTVWLSWGMYDNLSAHHVSNALGYTFGNGIFLLLAGQQIFGLARS